MINNSEAARRNSSQHVWLTATKCCHTVIYLHFGDEMTGLLPGDLCFVSKAEAKSVRVCQTELLSSQSTWRCVSLRLWLWLPQLDWLDKQASGDTFKWQVRSFYCWTCFLSIVLTASNQASLFWVCHPRREKIADHWTHKLVDLVVTVWKVDTWQLF